MAATKSIKALGIMSGTSLDGLDFAAVEFWQKNDKWNFNIIAAKTFSYSEFWKNKLLNAPLLSGLELTKLNNEFGRMIAKQALDYMHDINFKPKIIASHGHTVFHQPDKGFTLQIGSGTEIAVRTGIKTISDFRSLDVALGGQGAPLVPVGDKYLFPDFDCCLNLGGFSNISYDKNGKRIAFDICPVNIILNYFAEKQGLSFDKNGELGKKGNIKPKLLNVLNALPYYHKDPPKSLGREWLEKEFIPAIENERITAPSGNNHAQNESADLHDTMCTLYEHIAIQIGRFNGKNKMLVTGGGAYNEFLMERIQANTKLKIIIPEKKVIDFKEALIFAFLGVLKYHGKINCFASVTGARRNSSCGIISYGK